jgi:hypothetical protein
MKLYVSFLEDIAQLFQISMLQHEIKISFLDNLCCIWEMHQQFFLSKCDFQSYNLLFLNAFIALIMSTTRLSMP